MLVFFTCSMSLKDTRVSLKEINKVLEKRHKSREYLIKNTRDIVVLSSRAITFTHKGDMKQAKSTLKKADLLLKKCRKKVDERSERYLAMPEQELVEAHSLIAIVEKRSIPSHKTLQVSEESYILGLLDCIGELKRLITDKLRISELKEAIWLFEIMEDLYSLLYPLSIYDKIIHDARRKLDVNRILIEDIRLILTEEIRRDHLITALKKTELAK